MARTGSGSSSIKSDAMNHGDAREEARHLAEEAMEERRKGNKEEAEFVLKEARALDQDAVEDSLKQQRQNR